MASYEELRAAADAVWNAVEASVRPLFIVSINTSSIASGARETLAKLQELSQREGFDVMQTGDTGFAWMEPVVQVVKPGGDSVLYGKVTAARAEAFAGAALEGVASDHVIGSVSGDVAGAPALSSIDWMRIQTRWMMANCGVIDPDSIDHYIARGGYGQYIKASQTDPEELIKVITGSTLRGHSGSFFSTGTKWGFLRSAKAEPKYLVCNADEGDPGAWVNRVMMEGDPHTILEGMLIGAYATGAAYGWIYLRDEYPLATERMNRAIQQCRERGIFGDNALGTGVRFDAEVVRGAGAYVCGDETGLLASVNDGRGMPKIKPPFPAQSGVLDMPTNVNNVETYASVTTLLRVTPETFSTVGTEANRGTKLFTVSGAVAHGGCLEVPFGTKVSELLTAAGGIAGGRAFKALQQGGPLSGLLPASIAADLPLEPEPFRPLGAGMGGGGIVFLDDTACVIDLNAMTSIFLEDESCARCTTCRIGNQRMLEVIRRASRGEGDPTDVDRLTALGATMQNSNCFHGSLSPTIINNTLKYFMDEFNVHSREHRCPAKVCPALIRYRVAGSTPKVAEAAPICPTQAIVEQGGDWQIDDARCIRCGACRDIAADDIIVEDAFQDVIPVRATVPADVARSG